MRAPAMKTMPKRKVGGRASKPVPSLAIANLSSLAHLLPFFVEPTLMRSCRLHVLYSYSSLNFSHRARLTFARYSKYI